MSDKAAPRPELCVKAVKADGRVEFVLSDETLDRDGEKILHTAWRNADGASVPFLFGHDQGSLDNVIGRLSLKIDKRRKALVATPTFSKTDAGRKAEQLVLEGSLDTVSVGFAPYGWKDGNDSFAREDGEGWPYPQKGRVYTDCECVEGSLVPVPSNRNARTLEAVEALTKALPQKQHIEMVAVAGEEPPLTADEIKAIRSILNVKAGEAEAKATVSEVAAGDWFQTATWWR